MLEIDFETLIDDAESGVDEYLVFKDTMCGYSEAVCVCMHAFMCESRLAGCVHILLVLSEQQIYQPQSMYGNYCLQITIPSLPLPSKPLLPMTHSGMPS